MSFKWVNKENTDINISLSAFMTNPAGKIPSKFFFVFFGNSESADSSVGKSDNPSENEDILVIKPSEISSDIAQVHIIATVRSEKDKNFSCVKEAFFEIKDHATGKIIAMHRFFGTFISETAIEIGALFKENDTWYFQFFGKRYQSDLLFFLIKYYPAC